jgi:hypothetical protein
MDIDQAPIDSFITDLEAVDAPRHIPDQGRGPLAKKLMFNSQEMPEEQAAAFTVPPQSMISLKTLFILTKEVLELCPRGNNKDVIIIILVYDTVYIPC